MINYRPTKNVTSKTKTKRKLPGKARTPKKLSTATRLDRLLDDQAATWMSVEKLKVDEISTRIRVNDLEQRVNQLVEDVRPMRGPLPAALATRILELERKHESLERKHYALQYDVENSSEGLESVDPSQPVVTEEIVVSTPKLEMQAPRLDTFGVVFLVLSSVLLIGILILITAYSN